MHCESDSSGNTKVVSGDVHLCETLEHTDELDIFTTQVIQDYIEFRWDNGGRSHHYWGVALHMIYIIILCIYIDKVYVQGE
jgi:hypothetical protein